MDRTHEPEEKRSAEETAQQARAVRVIRNRDIPALERVYCRMQDILSLEDRREWIWGRMFNITKRLTGMPRSGQKAGFDRILGELDEMDGECLEQVSAWLKELRQAEHMLNRIPDGRERTMVRLYYMDQRPRAEIIRELGMTEYAFDRLRDRIEQADNMADVSWQTEDHGANAQRSGEGFEPGADVRKKNT